MPIKVACVNLLNGCLILIELDQARNQTYFENFEKTIKKCFLLVISDQVR